MDHLNKSREEVEAESAQGDGLEKLKEHPFYRAAQEAGNEEFIRVLADLNRKDRAREAVAPVRLKIEDLKSSGALEPYHVILDIKAADVEGGKFKQKLRVMVDGKRKGVVRVFDEGQDKAFKPIRGLDYAQDIEAKNNLLELIGIQMDLLGKNAALHDYQIKKLASLQTALLQNTEENFWLAIDADGEFDFETPMLTEYMAERMAASASDDLIGAKDGRRAIGEFVQEKLASQGAAVGNESNLEDEGAVESPVGAKVEESGALAAIYGALEKEMIVNTSYSDDERVKNSPWNGRVHGALLPQQVGVGRNGERRAKEPYGDDYGFKVFNDAEGRKFLRVGAFDGVGSAGEIQDMPGDAMEDILLMSELAGLSVENVARKGDRHVQFIADLMEGAFDAEARNVRLDQARAAGVVFDVFEDGEVRGVNKGDFKLFVLGGDAENGMKWKRLNKTQTGQGNRIRGAFGDGESPLKFSYKLKQGETLVALSDGVYKLFENSDEIGSALRGWQNNPELQAKFPDPAKYLLYFAETTRADAILERDWKSTKSIRDAYNGDFGAYMTKCHQVMKDAPGVVGKRKSDDMNCLIIESPIKA